MLAMLAFTACSSNNDEAVNTPQFWHVTLTASMGGATSRALSDNDNTITATFTKGDIVEVVNVSGNSIGTLTAKSDGASTTLEGTISGSIAVNDVLTLRYRSATANYDGQVGTLAGIATNQDYAEGTLTVKTTSPELTFTSNHVTLRAKQSITKFTFKDASTNANISVKTFGIAAAGLVRSIAADATSTETVGAVTGTLATASSDVYVALRNNTDAKQAYSFTIKDNDGNWYTGTKKANLVNGKNYATEVQLTKLPALTSSSDVGTIGVVGGLPAIVINNTTAVALMNAGALCPEAYGTYYSFANLPTLSNDWYVPTKDELDALAGISGTWGAPNGVNGCTFTIGGNTLFLPAAGYRENGSNLLLVSTDGYYWSSESVGEEPTSLAYYFDVDNSGAATNSEYKVDALTVRPFHALPTP